MDNDITHAHVYLKSHDDINLLSLEENLRSMIAGNYPPASASASSRQQMFLTGYLNRSNPTGCKDHDCSGTKGAGTGEDNSNLADDCNAHPNAMTSPLPLGENIVLGYSPRNFSSTRSTTIIFTDSFGRRLTSTRSAD
jgi:hypothetical protein